jgi:hypothetical protein
MQCVEMNANSNKSYRHELVFCLMPLACSFA